ncbi:hypothetical protein OROMI_015704 [Orobanche minor]
MFNSKRLKINDYVITNLSYELIMCIMKKLAHQSPDAWANATATVHCSCVGKHTKRFATA